MGTAQPQASVEAGRLGAAYEAAVQALQQELQPEGFWVGELSTSALSTATAVMALHQVARHGGDARAGLVAGGLRWLALHQNADGGWGDTPVSFSNISTTLLCRAAFHLTGAAAAHGQILARAEAWLTAQYGPAERWPEAVRRRYGKDRTFAVPILTTCALAGLVDWREVPALPFELACLPQSWFRLVRLHVVSYALPALIAIGQCIAWHRPSGNLLARWVRLAARARALRVLEAIQPSNGGYLEATPLTSFVTLSLASIGLARHPVSTKAVGFLQNSVRPDGSWPIDTNLATWVTTLAVNALASAGDLQRLPGAEATRSWLLRQQYRERHPYTGAAPGAWAWTDLPGGVPDADDTPGALLALAHLGPPAPELQRGVGWLLDLQNRDGGWPTFCRGWGHLPFDRSGADLTAHALRALRVYRAGAAEPARVERALRQGFAYLARQQRADGSWLPLWFGNQHAPDDENPTYGTTRVLAAYRDFGRLSEPSACRASAWLLAAQNPDGGYGGTRGTPSSSEETSLALEILLDLDTPHQAERALTWLVEKVEAGGLAQPTPIGFYFAKLWYFEKLYPLAFAVAALGRARRWRGTRQSS